MEQGASAMLQEGSPAARTRSKVMDPVPEKPAEMDLKEKLAEVVWCRM